jgi:hypothetical protein
MMRVSKARKFIEKESTKSRVAWLFFVSWLITLQGKQFQTKILILIGWKPFRLLSLANQACFVYVVLALSGL